MKITPSKIEFLRPWEIFVFGSNLAGKHGSGAALDARILFGAVQGVGEGLTGRCYALPTKDHHISILALHEIGVYVKKLRQFVDESYDEKLFLITAVGCGLAGHTPKQIAPLFANFMHYTNVSLPQEFVDILSIL